MLHLFGQDGARTHCLPPHTRCKHHTVCTHEHNQDEAPGLGTDHHCLHGPDGTHIGYATPVHSVDCACSEDDCRHLQRFLAENADKGIRVG